MSYSIAVPRFAHNLMATVKALPGHVVFVALCLGVFMAASLLSLTLDRAS